MQNTNAKSKCKIQKKANTFYYYSDNNIWTLLDDSEFDKLLKVDQITNSKTFFEFAHKLWSFTPDIDGNLWFIANKNDIIKS